MKYILVSLSHSIYIISIGKRYKFRITKNVSKKSVDKIVTKSVFDISNNRNVNERWPKVHVLINKICPWMEFYVEPNFVNVELPSSAKTLKYERPINALPRSIHTTNRSSAFHLQLNLS